MDLFVVNICVLLTCRLGNVQIHFLSQHAIVTLFYLLIKLSIAIIKVRINKVDIVQYPRMQLGLFIFLRNPNHLFGPFSEIFSNTVNVHIRLFGGFHYQINEILQNHQFCCLLLQSI